MRPDHVPNARFCTVLPSHDRFNLKDGVRNKGLSLSRFRITKLVWGHRRSQLGLTSQA
jgi:hypothetical protein